MRTLPIVTAVLTLACANPPGEPAAPAPAAPPPAPPPPAVPPTPARPTAATPVAPTPSPTTGGAPVDFCAITSSYPPTDETTQRAAREQAWAMFQATPGADRCDVHGWVTDPDPNGLNVRDAPARSGAVLATIKNTPAVAVVGHKDGWLLVCRASPVEADTYGVAGWVHASMVGTGTRGYDTGGSPVREGPADGFKISGTIPTEGEIVAMACSGTWWKGRHGATVGWVARGDICASPITTCP